MTDFGGLDIDLTCRVPFERSRVISASSGLSGGVGVVMGVGMCDGSFVCVVVWGSSVSFVFDFVGVCVSWGDTDRCVCVAAVILVGISCRVVVFITANMCVFDSLVSAE